MIVDSALVVSLAVYLAASVLLVVFGLNLMWFSLVAVRHRRHRVEPPGNPGPLPAVTVQLPIYNELFVARRVIEAVCRLDYPRHLLQVQVLDDSDDETVGVVAQAVAAARADGIDIRHVRRPGRRGYKAGALGDGLGGATGSLIAVFDADFVPPEDFLRRTVGHFVDPDLAFVQARWGHLNGRFSWLTRLQVPAIDAHFLVEQRARGVGGHWFNFNGTAGIWRSSAIHDAGGWQTDTLTEDLDLSYRAHLRGWRGLYLPDLVVPGELPADVASFRRQQHRWARGSLECARKLLGPVWRSDAGLGTKFQASVHLLAYSVHVLLLVMVLAYPAVIVALDRLPITGFWFGAGMSLSVAALAPALFLITGQGVPLGRRGGSIIGGLPAIVGMMLFGSGLMLSSTRAAFEIGYRPEPEFERTPKFGLVAGTKQGPGPAGNRYRRRLDRIVVAEAALGLYTIATAALAAHHRSWGIAFYAAFFGTGLLTVAGTSTVQAVRRRRRPADLASFGPVATAAPSSGSTSSRGSASATSIDATGGPPDIGGAAPVGAGR